MRSRCLRKPRRERGAGQYQPCNERTTKDLRKQIQQARPIQLHRSGQAVPAQREPCRRHQGSVLLARSPPAHPQNRRHARIGGRAQIPMQTGGHPSIHNPANPRSQRVNLRPERMGANAGMGIREPASLAAWRHGVSKSPLHPARNPCMRRPGFLHPKTPREPVFSTLRPRNVRRGPVTRELPAHRSGTPPYHLALHRQCRHDAPRCPGLNPF